MVVYCNNNITEVHYSGYTIDKIYACGGELVYSGSSSSFFVHNRYLSGSTVFRDDISCEEVTHLQGVLDCSVIKQFNTHGSVCDSEDNAFILDSVQGDCVTEIKYNTYKGCTHLSGLTIGKNVETIGEQAFSGCTSLTSVTIPDSVTSIGNYVFASCINVHNLTIGTGITSIGAYAFDGCRFLGFMGKIIIKATTPPALGTGAFDNQQYNQPIYVPAASVNAYKASPGWSAYSSRIQAM